MRAVHYKGDRILETARVGSPAPRHGEVQIEVAYTGICGTDLHVFNGHMDRRVTFPAVMGHEMSGRVAALGDGVEEWSIGDPVTVIPLVSCGGCPACDAGHSHLCHFLTFLGIDADGAMQERWNVPAGTLLRLPARMPLDVAALIEPLAVAVHDVGRADVQDGDQVLVVGGGPVGLLISRVAQVRGAEVLLSEPHDARRRLAEEAGISSIDPVAVDVPSFVEEWSSGAGADVAFEVSGSAPGVQAAVASLRVRGRVVLVGVHPEVRSLDLFRFFWRELDLVGARLYGRSDFERAIALIDDGWIDVAPLISAIEPVDAARAAFDALEAGQVMKVLVDCQK